MFKYIFLFLLLFGISFKSLSSLPAPKVNCISVLPNGNIEITWEKVNDPTGIFDSYKVYFVVGSSTVLLQSISNINQLTYTHIGVNGQNSSYQYIIGTTCSSAVTNLADTVCSMKLTVNNPGTGLAILNWNPIFKPTNSTSASNWYKIYQEYPLGTWTLIDSVPYGREYYRDTITICNDTVNYRVTNDNIGCTSISSVDGSNFTDVIPPYEPVIRNISVDTSNNLATVSWDRSNPDDIEGYIILKFISGGWVPIDTIYGINNTTYSYLLSNAGGESECYGIAAIDSCWYGTPLSPNTSSMSSSHCSIFLESSYAACSKQIELTWNAYTNWKSGVDNYYVYYNINGGTNVLAGTTSSTNFTLNNVNADSTYCFVIKSVSGDFNDTANSNKECVFTSYPLISDTNYLQTVTVLSENQIQIRIYTPSYNTINGYNIFRSDNNGSSFIFIGYANNTGNPIVFNDNNVFANEQTYIYKAIAVDSCNNITDKESNIGNSILLTTTSNSGDYKINLDWSDYQKWNGDVKEFQIFRKLGINPPVLIASVPFNTYSYQDDISAFYSSSDDGKFCYYIEAVENVNQFGFSETSKSNISCTSPDYLIYIPNTFTPNDDGLNDEFLPIIGFANYNKYTFRVYNRIGSEIFITTDINEGWDGKHKNKNVPVGVYVYNILIEDSQGTPIQKNGTILILK